MNQFCARPFVHFIQLRISWILSAPLLIAPETNILNAHRVIVYHKTCEFVTIFKQCVRMIAYDIMSCEKRWSNIWIQNKTTTHKTNKENYLQNWSNAWDRVHFVLGVDQSSTRHWAAVNTATTTTDRNIATKHLNRTTVNERRSVKTMADESLHLPANQNLDYHIITLFQRLETMRKDSNIHRIGAKLSSSMKVKHNMQVEIRTLEFWR